MIDNVCKKKIDELSENPSNPGWDKDTSWERLQKKRKQKFFRKFYYYAAAILILGFVLGKQFNSGLLINESEEISNTYTEIEKRQKLAEIEANMSGNYTSYKICYACDEIYYRVIKEYRPVQFRYFENNLN